jgi:methionine-rich copper-binding protein CopC
MPTDLLRQNESPYHVVVSWVNHVFPIMASPCFVCRKVNELVRHKISGALAIVAASLITAPVGAHPTLKSASPAADVTSTSSPAEITLEFSEGVIARFSGLELKDEFGKAIATGVVTADPKDRKRLIAPVLAPLNPGRYTVNWHVVSADTHRIQGQYSFRIGR